jgi:hypothetical protein
MHAQIHLIKFDDECAPPSLFAIVLLPAPAGPSIAMLYAILEILLFMIFPI